MKVACPSCKATLAVDASRIPPQGAKLKCPSCQTMFPVKPEAVALPGSSAPVVPVLPPLAQAADGVPSGDFDFDTATRVAPMPAHSGAVPLPGAATFAAPAIPETTGFPAGTEPSEFDFDSSTRVAPLNIPHGAVPLPGSAAAPALAAPEASGFPAGTDPSEFDFDSSTRVAPLNVPSDAVPLPGHAAPQPAGTGTLMWGKPAAVPLPGASAGASPAPPMPSIAPAVAPSTGGSGTLMWGKPSAVPLPGNTSVGAPPPLGDLPPPMTDSGIPMASPDDISDVASGPASALTLPPDEVEFNPEAIAQASEASDFEDAATNVFDINAMSPQPASATTSPAMDFSDLPSAVGDDPRPDDVPPPSAPTEGFDFSDLGPSANPPPLAQVGAVPDFSDLPVPHVADLPAVPEAPQDAPEAPPPADDLNFNFSDLSPAEPPPPAPGAAPSDPSSAFGDVDFSADLPPPSDLPPNLDDGFSMPPPPGAEGEPLSEEDALKFAEESAFARKQKGAQALEATQGPSRYHVRRQTGKIFGPFEEDVVGKMLEEGQLQGNEDVSTDQNNWLPVADVPLFKAAIEKFASQSAGQGAPAAVAVAPTVRSPERTSEALKELYEGRMAAIAVTQSSDVVGNLRKRIPHILAGLGVLLILGVGFGFGLTRYGIFGFKAFFPSKVKVGTPEFAALTKARESLQSDTYKGFQEAKAKASQALQSGEFLDARAVSAQAIFYLKRRYSAASADEYKTASSRLPDIELLGKKHIEVVKAQAGYALSERDADKALNIVGDALARSENQDDLELLFLRAEGQTQKKQSAQALATLTEILKKRKDSARAHFAIGQIHQAALAADEAAKSFQAAIDANPDHAAAAVELAAIELILRKDPTRAKETIEPALADERRVHLGPSELARALAIEGESIAQLGDSTKAIEILESALKADKTNAFAKASLARVYVIQHDYEKASPLLAQASTEAPDNLEYLDSYLVALIETGKMLDAKKVVEGAAARFPSNARLAYLTGRIEDALDHPREAEAAYQRALASDGEMVDAYLRLTLLLVKSRRMNDARAQLSAASQKAPQSAAVQRVTGDVAFSEAKYDEAQAAYEKAVSLDPNEAEAYLGLSKVALAKKDLATAEKHVDKSLSIANMLKGARLQQGKVYWAQNRLDDALAVLQKAHAEDPGSTEISIALGAVQLDKRELPAATTTLMTVLENDSSNADANYYLARVKNAKSEHSGAIDLMRKAIDQLPKRAEYHYWMGRLQKDAKHSNEAMDSWKTALAINPNYADALEATAQQLFEQNELVAAIERFEKALKLDPTRKHLWAAIGDCHAAVPDWDKAISAYKKALELDPDTRAVFFKLGLAFTEKKSFSDAIGWYKKATVVEPNNPQAWLNLGWALKEQKLRKEALVAFRTYLEKNPEAHNKKEIEDEIDWLKQEKGP